MKKIIFVFSTLFVLFSCNEVKKEGDEKKEGNAEKKERSSTENKNAVKPDSATMAKNWEAYMTPGDMHKMMAKWDGNWTADISMWMEPGAPVQKTPGNAAVKTILNGLYSQSTNTATMMGMPFTGISTTAYDNHSNEFINTWIDNMGSGIMVLKGTLDAATKTLTLKGRSTDPGTKQEINVRQTMKFTDDNTQEMEMFMEMPDGKEFKTMHIDFKRKS